jgi:DNA-binding NtrC family response regulator
MTDHKGQSNILITDDTAELLEALAGFVRRAGYAVVTATSGKEALDAYLKAKQERVSFDAIISDVEMPNGTGIEFLKSVRELDKSTPFFFMTGGAKINAKEAKLLGATELFEKPFATAAILSGLKEALSTKKTV